MTNDKFGMTNVYGTKAVSLWSDEGWDIVSSAPDKDEQNLDNLWRSLAWPYRGVNIISDKLASIPFDIVDGKTIVDSSKEYKNKLGFLPNPKSLIWLLGASITLQGYGYLFSDNVGNARKKLRYIVPSSVKFDVSRPEVASAAKMGKIILTRTVSGRATDFEGGKDIIYFWAPDPGVELGPPNSSPMKAALSAAGVLWNIDQYVKAYWQRGAIRAMVFAIKGNPPEEQKKSLLSWYRTMIAGVKNAFNAAVINADGITTETVGDGLTGLQDTNLTMEKREEIATAFGIPQTILFSGSAAGLGGGGVADADRIKLFEDKIIPDSDILAEVINNQIFANTNYRWVFRPHELPIFEKDRQAMSTALVGISTYFNNISAEILPPEIGFNILGYPIDEDVQAQLNKWAADKAKAKENTPLPVVSDSARYVVPTDAQQPPAPNKAMMDDLAKWQRKAIKALGKPEKMIVFDSVDILPAIMARIRDGLKSAQTEDDVRTVFAADYTAEGKSEILLLAEAINKLAEK